MFAALPAVEYFDLEDGRVKLAWARRSVLRVCRANANELLSSEERQHHAAIRSPHHADAWLAGRVLAKVLMSAAQCLGRLNPHQITIRSADHKGRGTRPRPWQGACPLDMDLSLSHGSDVVLAGLTPDTRTRVGVDVVSFGTVTGSVQRMWFSPSERRWDADDAAASQIWAAKEAVYKALNEGEPFYPRRINVEDRDATSCQCRYHSPTGLRRVIVRTWQSHGAQLACAVALRHELSELQLSELPAERGTERGTGRSLASSLFEGRT